MPPNPEELLFFFPPIPVAILKASVYEQAISNHALVTALIYIINSP